jgi:anti-sigma factor RsiW
MSHLPEDHLSGYMDDQSLTSDERQNVARELEQSPLLRAECASLEALKHRLRTSAPALRGSLPDATRDAVLAALSSVNVLQALQTENHEQPQAPEKALQNHYAAAIPEGITSTQKSQRTKRNTSTRLWLAAASLALCAGAYGVYSLITRSTQPDTAATNAPSSKVPVSQPQVGRGGTSATTAAGQKFSPLDFRTTALQNFRAVSDGKVALECKTASFNELRSFCQRNGITFTLIKPKIDAALLGGVITTENGEKSVHLVYRKDDTIIYMWQIAEHVIGSPQTQPSTIHTTNHVLHEPTSIHVEPAIARVIHDQGKWYWEESADQKQQQKSEQLAQNKSSESNKPNTPTFAVWEDRATLCVVIADMPQRKMEPLFQY